MKLPLSYSVLLLTLLCYFSITIVNACDESSVKIKPLLKNRSPTLQQQQGLSPEETQYITLPEANKSREYLQFYTSFTHVAGTPGDLEAAAYTLGKFKSFGLNAELMPETVLLSLPLEAAIASVSSPQSGTYNATLSEDIVLDDRTTDTLLRNHSFHGYSPSGEASGPLVYVNYGTFEDFEYLKSKGVQLNGSIAIARYGSIFRGLKAYNAQSNGMLGIIVYSDPIDDGFTQGAVFPNGPWRPSSGIQRGSVQFNSLCAGDPSRGADICGFTQDQLIPQIPVLPMGYGDAINFLSKLDGLPAPTNWVGALPINYNIGPGSATVYIKTNNTFFKSQIWNVIAKIDGTDDQEGDDFVVIGNHRDAWVYGAVDPNSGTASLLEIARAYGNLLQSSWKPKRGIILASWSGEEYGLLGSTAFGERFADELSQHAVAYFNVDTGVLGPSLFVNLVPSLHQHYLDTAGYITDPNTEKLLNETWDGSYGILGSGSDYTVFLDALGITSSDLGFGGPYGVYHSVYDDFYWMEHFGDPEFKYHQACAQYLGLLAMRVADARVLPFNFEEYHNALQVYINTTSQIAKQAGFSLDLSAVVAAVSQFGDAAAKVTAEIATANSDPQYDVVTLNRKLFLAERQFLDSDGLPARKWFKHLIFAPDRRNGYSASTFPGVVDMLRTNDSAATKEAVNNLATAISNAASFLSK